MCHVTEPQSQNTFLDHAYQVSEISAENEVKLLSFLLQMLFSAAIRPEAKSQTLGELYLLCGYQNSPTRKT